MDAGRALHRARRAAGLTQRELALATGVAQPTIARIERAQVDPRLATLTKLLAACGWRMEPIPRAGKGVDRTLIRDLRSRTPEERLQLSAADARGLAAFDRAVKASRAKQ